MLVELDAVALDLPGPAVLGDKVIFIGVFAFLKTARERTRFLVGGFRGVLRRGQSSRARKHEQRNEPGHDLAIKSLASKRVENLPHRRDVIARVQRATGQTCTLLKEG